MEWNITKLNFLEFLNLKAKICQILDILSFDNNDFDKCTLRVFMVLISFQFNP